MNDNLRTTRKSDESSECASIDPSLGDYGKKRQQNDESMKPLGKDTLVDLDYEKLDNQIAVTSSGTESQISNSEIYMNWQFVVVLVAISFGFNASFLATINSWNGELLLIPVILLVKPLWNLLGPMDLTEIERSVNLTTVASGLDFRKMAIGLNTTQLESSFDPNTIFWGAAHTNLREFLSGINFTHLAQGIQLKPILRGMTAKELVSGIQFRNLSQGLNLETTVPNVYYTIPESIDQLKEGLWIYPTMIVCQIISSVFFGRLSDYIGRRWIFLLGNIIAMVGFIATGRAEGGSEIVGLNALIGIGTGIQILGPWLALAELVPVRQRFTVTALCLGLLAPLLALHVAIATAFIEHKHFDGWRWPYYINGILSFVSFVGLFIAYHPPTYHQLHNHPTQDPPVKDWIGLAAFTTAIAVISYALGWGKLIWPWSDPQVIICVTIGGLALVGFCAYHVKFGDDTNAYPAYLMKSYTHVSQMILASVGTLVWLFSPIAQLVIFLTITPRLDMKGAWKNLWGAGFAAGFLVAAVALKNPKHLKWHTVMGYTFGMIFLAALRGVIGLTDFSTAMAFFFLQGFGQSYFTVVTYVTAPMTAHHRDMGLVVGLVSAYRGLVFAAVRALFLTLYINQLLGKLQRNLLPTFGEFAPISQSLTGILNGFALFQRTRDWKVLLKVPILVTMFDALMNVLAQSWHFIVTLAFVYFLGTWAYSLTTPNVDSYLSNSVYARLNRRKFFSRNS